MTCLRFSTPPGKDNLEAGELESEQHAENEGTEPVPSTEIGIAPRASTTCLRFSAPPGPARLGIITGGNAYDATKLINDEMRADGAIPNIPMKPVANDLSKEYGPWAIALSNNLKARTYCTEMDNQLNVELVLFTLRSSLAT